MNEVEPGMLQRTIAMVQSEMREVRAVQTRLVAETRSDLTALRAYVGAHLSGVKWRWTPASSSASIVSTGGSTTWKG